MAGAAFHIIVAGAAEQQVPVTLAEEPVVTGEAVERVVAGAAVEDLGDREVANEVARIAGNEVMAVAAEDTFDVGGGVVVLAGLAVAAEAGQVDVQVIRARGVVGGVEPDAAAHVVGAEPAVQRVVGAVAAEEVVAVVAEQQIASGAAPEDVVARAAVERRRNRNARMHVEAVVSAVATDHDGGDYVVEQLVRRLTGPGDGDRRAIGGNADFVASLCAVDRQDGTLKRDSGHRAVARFGVATLVGARAAGERVDAVAAVERVVAVVAEEDIVSVAAAKHVVAAKAAEPIGTDPAPERVRAVAAADRRGHHGVIDDVVVTPQAADRQELHRRRVEPLDGAVDVHPEIAVHALDDDVVVALCAVDVQLGSLLRAEAG